MLPDAFQSNPSLMILESGIAAATAAIAYGWPRLGAGAFARVERLFAPLAVRKGWAVAIVALSVVLLRLAILPLFPIPLPFSPNDFSFLLQADTFAHGHLANSTPAMWMHFESIHLTMIPTYQSMYFPGEGLLLAAGQVLAGNPWLGLLAIDGLMCGALCWMLQAWLPPWWALLGGFIAVIRLGLFSDWINTYHTGGSLAALAGALMLGALPRLMKTSRLQYGLPLGIGIAILALTRPYEGLLLSVAVGGVLVRWIWKGANRPAPMALARAAILPLGIVVIAVAWLGYYDLNAFGKATTLPYTVDRAQYATAPYYIWQHARPEPHYRYAVIRDFYKSEMGDYASVHSLKGFVPATLKKVGYVFLYYAGFTFILPLIMIRRVFLDRRTRFLIGCVLTLAVGMVMEIYLLPHYVAPFTAAFYAIGLQMMRHLRLWKPEGKPVGLALVRMAVFSCVALAGARLFAKPLHIAQREWPPAWNCIWSGPEHFGTERAQIEHRLEELPGPQLAIVRYSAKHYQLDEWVYNLADIDDSKVVWARDSDAADNRELMKYYRNRTVWLVEPDAIPARISPYPTVEMETGD